MQVPKAVQVAHVAAQALQVDDAVKKKAGLHVIQVAVPDSQSAQLTGHVVLPVGLRPSISEGFAPVPVPLPEPADGAWEATR